MAGKKTARDLWCLSQVRNTTWTTFHRLIVKTFWSMCTKKRKAKLLGWCSFFSRKKLLFKFWHSIKRLQSLEYVPPTWDIIYANRLELVSFYWSFWAMSWDPLQRIEKSSFLPTVNLCTKKLLSKVRSQLLAFLATSVFSSGHKFQWWVLHKF